MIEVGEIKASPANGIGRYKEGSLDVSAGWTINKTSGEEARGIQINLTQIWEEEHPNEGQGRVCVAMIDKDEIAALLEGMNYMLSPESDPRVTVWYTTRDSFKILHQGSLLMTAIENDGCQDSHWMAFEESILEEMKNLFVKAKEHLDTLE